MMEREGVARNLISQSRARIAHSRDTIKNTLRLVGRKGSEVENLPSGMVEDKRWHAIENKKAQSEQATIDIEVQQTIVDGWPSRPAPERSFGTALDRA